MANPPETSAPDQSGREARLVPHDKVCVRDLILPTRIGIWSEEQGITQRVRFTVELSVSPGGHRPGDLGSVVSYDYIIDGIRAAIADGHVLLTETIAERIAAHCLSHRRAAEVRVVVEKLDRFPGAALGCEIVRRRVKSDEPAGRCAVQT
jgi:dihydroneopterin aldolase